MLPVKRNGFVNFPSLFDDFFSRDAWNSGMDIDTWGGATVPAVNIRETNDHYEVEMAAPGMKKEDFSVELDGNMLTITSQKESQQEDKEGDKFSRREFSHQSFTRRFQLPKEVVDDERIEAKYTDGVLKLVIPRKEEAKQKPRKMIDVR